MPRGKTKFDRCVKAVTKRGGSYDPRAVCGAQRAKAKGKRNPADTASGAFERFHGRKPTEYIKVTKHIHHHAKLWSVGDLESLKIRTEDGRSIVTLDQFNGTILAANPKAFEELRKHGKAKLTQLFVEGGDQRVKLRDFGIDASSHHEIETLGKAVFIGYHTVKVHLGDEGGDAIYGHKFRSTRAGDKHVTLRVARYPDVIYRVLDKQLEFSGGSYEIRAEGIDK